MPSSATLVFVRILSSLAFLEIVGTAPEPFVAWSFDKYNGTRLIPDYSEDPRFQGDFSRLDTNASEVLKPGMEGNAIYVPGKTFALASNINGTDCIGNPIVCENGLTITFWLKLEDWNGNERQVIFTTTTYAKSLPGVYFGKGESDHLYFMVKLNSSAMYETQFSHQYAWKRWSHFGLTWSKDADTLLVYVNGSALNDSTTTRNDDASSGMTDFTIGYSTGPVFLLDELNLFYELLSAEEMTLVYDPPITTTFRPTVLPMTTTPSTLSTTDSGANNHLPLWVCAITVVSSILLMYGSI